MEKLVLQISGTTANFYHGKKMFQPTFTAKTPLISTIVTLSNMGFITKAEHNEMLAQVNDSKMPSCNVGVMPHMNLTLSLFGMKFSSDPESRPITSVADQLFQSFKEHNPLYQLYKRQMDAWTNKHAA